MASNGQTWIRLPVLARHVARIEDESGFDRRARVLNWLAVAHGTSDIDPTTSYPTASSR